VDRLPFDFDRRGLDRIRCRLDRFDDDGRLRFVVQAREDSESASQRGRQDRNSDGIGGELAHSFGDDATLRLRMKPPAFKLNHLVVDLSLLRVAQDGIGADDLPEP
jgi:hypothetical protein